MKAADLQSILETQRYKCALSGRTLTPENCTLDHRVPLARGGTHSIDNWHLVTDEVNRAKGTMTIEEFVAMCCDVARTSGWVAN